VSSLSLPLGSLWLLAGDGDLDPDFLRFLSGERDAEADRLSLLTSLDRLRGEPEGDLLRGDPEGERLRGEPEGDLSRLGDGDLLLLLVAGEGDLLPLGEGDLLRLPLGDGDLEL